MLIFNRGIHIVYSKIQQRIINSAMLIVHSIDAACEECNLFLFHCTTPNELFNVARSLFLVW